MYGVSGFNQKFYTVNLLTGMATQISSTGIGFQNGGDLAANSRGSLYGVSKFSTHSYNKTTGAATFIGFNLLPDFVRAADFDPNNVFYGVEGGGGTDNLHLRFLVTINLPTVLGFLVGAIPIDDLDGIAFEPVMHWATFPLGGRRLSPVPTRRLSATSCSKLDRFSFPIGLILMVWRMRHYHYERTSLWMQPRGDRGW